VTEKLPYWQHPSYDPYEDPASGIVQHEFLKPITTDLSYGLISECVCSIDPAKHDPDVVIYSFGEGNSEEFPSTCHEKNYVDPGELLLQASESWDMHSEISIRKIREDFYLLSYELHPTEPNWDSGEEAAWEGGNVEFNFPELTEDQKAFNEERMQREIAEMIKENSKYEDYPVKPRLRDAILIKADPISLSESVYEFLNLQFPKLTEFLSFRNERYGLPSKFQYSGWLGLTLNHNVDHRFFNSLEACFKRTTNEETS
jgi:hypothetical protein